MALTLRLMTPGDIELGMRLKGQAGWNQTPADWQRFLELEPNGCFVAEWDGPADRDNNDLHIRLSGLDWDGSGE